ncbi:threonine ammonia-lyase, biosynthetic [Candidatus Saccharibacteria bacterium]|nr:threonine ammonia-lyase, biosynthetic [Candidatus Saccharibacteria bacterium]
MKSTTKQTILADIYDIAIRTPLDYAPGISNKIGSNVYLKREDLQPVHSFKIRGAYNKLLQLNSKEKACGIIAASAGNHAQGVALAARTLNISALIIMPVTTPQIKVDAVKNFGADVELYGDSYSDAALFCKTRVKKTGRTYIHPFDDLDVIAGQGTIAKELLEQSQNITHIFVPVGGGGLVCGIGQYIKELRPDIKIISVEPNDSNVMQASLKANKRITLEHVGIFAEGVAVKKLGKNTFDIARNVINESLSVSNDQICAAIKVIFEETRTIVEPSGALGIAGIIEYSKIHKLSKDDTLVAINSGANMSFERLQYIAERTLLGSGQEALFEVELNEKPGALDRFCNDVVVNHSITQFGYRLKQRDHATIFVGVSVKDSADKYKFINKMQKYNYKYKDVSDDDIVKEHTRHMIGDSGSLTKGEYMYRILFPERPRALSDFLTAVSGNWNISLFHYRGQGADRGSVLIAFEAKNKKQLESALDKTGYSWSCVLNKLSV